MKKLLLIICLIIISINTLNSQSINDVKTIVFSIIGDYANFIPFSTEIKSLSFGNPQTLSTSESISYDMTLSNFPNPFKSTTTIKLIKKTQFVDIKVIDVMGRTIDEQRIKTNSNGNQVIYNSEKLSTGIYKYILKAESSNNYVGTFLID